MTMKTRYLIPLWLCSFWAACGAVPSIPVRDADGLRGGAVQFVDVREEYQFIGWDSEEGPGGHIAGAMDFPASWLSLDVKPGTIDTELTRRGLKKNVKTVLYGNGSLEPSIGMPGWDSRTSRCWRGDIGPGRMPGFPPSA